MLCAGVPDAPPALQVELASQDIIKLTSARPLSDGGSPVQGFQIYMKKLTDENFTLVLDGKENPNLLSFTTTIDHTGQPLTPDTYLFKIAALNWVGTSEFSEELTVTIPFLISPVDSMV